jgi:predicted phage terminase large subunit-like protein
LTVWDTAFEANNRADYSACITWGVFFNEDTDAYNIIMLNAFKDRMEFPELKRRALENYKEWEPDNLIVEKKASGAPLIYELRAMGIPVMEVTPVRGAANSPNNKVARLNAITDVFSSGVVWVPNSHWAEEVVEEVASFPSGDHDDYVDCVIMGIFRFRHGGFMRLPTDEPAETKYFKRRTGGYY